MDDAVANAMCAVSHTRKDQEGRNQETVRANTPRMSVIHSFLNNLPWSRYPF